MDNPRASRFLEQTLLVNFIVHALAMLSAALLLAPGLPGGLHEHLADRAAYVAAHPWLWRLGWLPWHLCALLDVVTGVALVCTPWVPRLPAWLTLLVTLCAVVPEQTGEVTWVTRGVQLAAEAGDPSAYAELEARSFHLATAVGASLYIAMALGWTWCFAASGAWSRTLTWLAVLTWGTLSVGSVGLLLPEPLRPGLLLAGAANGVGFVLLEVWLLLVTEQVLRRTRRDEPYGRWFPWRHPSTGVFGRLADAVANSRFARLVGEWLPTPAFRSDIRDVIYVNYLVDAERLAPMVPAGLELQRLGPDGRFALMSFLTYRHGHFGPALLGPLRRLLPSPIQSNWRLYVLDPRTGKLGVYFFTTAIAGTLHALAARLLSEGIPMHVPDKAEVTAHPDGRFTVLLDPGKGSAPDVRAELSPGPPDLPPPYNEVWDSYRSFLLYAVTQDRALTVQPWYNRVTRQEIQLGITAEECEPLAGRVESRAAQAIVGPAQAVCFRVASVRFRFEKEEYDRLG